MDDPRQRFAGRVSIITGGTKGLGAAMSRRLAQHGAVVAACFARDEAGADVFARQCAADGLAVSVHRVDIADSAQCNMAVGEIVDRYGRIDHLVNNAGILANGKLADTSDSEWTQVISVDLTGAFFMTRATLPAMTAAGFGRIVNISSIAAVKGSTRQGPYSAAKAGLIGMTRTLAREVARHGITANVLLTGTTDTGATSEVNDPAVNEALVKLIPVRRLGRGNEIAHAVAFLLDDEASYVTGAVLPVDGGFSM
jgi:NAD(P)-dependent dehydrogenase (short-subunit alcohol dehydrogenase family)